MRLKVRLIVKVNKHEQYQKTTERVLINGFCWIPIHAFSSCYRLSNFTYVGTTTCDAKRFVLKYLIQHIDWYAVITEEVVRAVAGVLYFTVLMRKGENVVDSVSTFRKVT